MPNILCVPVQIDALCLQQDQLVVEAKGDFSQLPYTTPASDVNAGNVNLSDTILSQEFQNQNLTLKQGVHLHWALPDGLAQGVQQADDSIVYFQVPDRWLVTRIVNGKKAQQWIVESDYLHPEGATNDYDGIAFPIDLQQFSQWVATADGSAAGAQPYRYLGRQLDYSGWSETAADRLRNLTVLGYGESTFAAFYPNCYSVFGCHDPAATDAATLNTTEYQVIGWYSDPADDPLAQWLAANAELTLADQLSGIQEEFMWKLDPGLAAAPENILCFGSLTFDTAEGNFTNSSTTELTVAIGNSGGEALATLMANTINQGNRNVLEDQLMAILQAGTVGSSSTDVGPRYQKAFHTAQFASQAGGTQWDVTLDRKATPTQAANNPTKAQQPSVQLPPGLADLLNDLNRAQRVYDKNVERIATLQHHLFADWYKYMAAAYPPADQIGNFPDPDEIRWFIETRSLPELKRLVAATGTLSWTTSSSKTVTKPKADSSGSSGGLAAAAIQAVLDQLKLYNGGKPAALVFDGKLNMGKVPTGLTTSAAISWVDNTPFTKKCLDFQAAQKAWVSAKAPAGTSGVSMWVRLASQQAADGTLLAVTDLGEATIDQSGIGPLWNRVVINGVELDPHAARGWGNFPKDQWFHLYLEANPSFSGSLYAMGASGTSGFCAGQLAGLRLFNAALSLDEIFVDRNMFTNNTANLRTGSAPSYYQPNEPVLLLTGADIMPGTRHGFDGQNDPDDVLACDTQSLAAYPPASTDLTALKKTISGRRPSDGSSLVGYDTWTRAPWNPFMMEWETEVFPVLKAGGQSTGAGGYASTHITDNYVPQTNVPDLVPLTGSDVCDQGRLYSGYTVLTPAAQTTLQAQITVFLNNQTETDFQRYYGIDATALSSDLLASYDTWYAGRITLDGTNMADFSAWLDQLPAGLGTPIANNIIPLSVEAYDTVGGMAIQSQSLGGFNPALLMFKQTMQLPITDPLGFDTGQQLAADAAAAVGGQNASAPEPLSSFMPFRTGGMDITRLYVIDTFGQVKRVDNLDQLYVPQSLYLDVDYQQGSVYVPPRFAQPARIQFRWLSAADGEQQITSVPQSNPICGWLLPNNLDFSIMVYDQQGYCLGLIDQTGTWRPSPGDLLPMEVGDIANPYLRNVINRLLADAAADGTSKYVQDFINTMDSALASVSTENYGQQQGLSLLMGRPLAVVRATVDLDLMGGTEVNQSWNAFRLDLGRDTRDTDGYEHIMVPLRVGDRGQLNDGVIGHWQEDGAGQLGDSFYTTTAPDANRSANIVSLETAPDALQLSVAADPVALTLLIDPNGTVDVHSGVLPTQTISIPSQQYAAALQQINITFLTAPLITPRDTITVGLPAEPGYQWAWVQQLGQQWQQTGTTGMVSINDFTAAFSNGTAIWDALVASNWIQPIDDSRATLVAIDQRTSPDLGTEFSTQMVAIQAILAGSAIQPPSFTADFVGGSEIVEGWLKLSPAATTSTTSTTSSS